MTVAQMKVMFSNAIALGCDGVTTQTKNGSEGLNVSMSFIAEKLPTVEKSILGYKRADTPKEYDKEKLTIDGYTDYYVYNENVELEFGDTVLYQFTVTKYNTMTTKEGKLVNTITYSDASLADPLISFNQDGVKTDLNDSGMNITTSGETKQKVYYATYKIDKEDLANYSNGTFTNKVTLQYGYKSTYSGGEYGGSVEGHVTCKINGLVYYEWANDVPEAIQKDTTNYKLPEQQAVTYGDSFNVAQTKYKSYTVENGKWTFLGWTSDSYEKNDGDYFKGGENLTMVSSGSVTFVGHWKFEENEVTINYVAVGPTGATNFGSVNPTTETVAVTSGNAQGSTATAGDGFRFVGWYDDENCTGDVLSPDANYVPVKPQDGKWVEGTFYAKFEYDTTSLTITKTAAAGTTFDSGDSFVFTVKGGDLPAERLKVVITGAGTKTITGLTVGETYTVTEDTDWSWRYTPTYTVGTTQTNSIKLVADASENVVTVTNSKDKNQWLSGSAQVKNILKDGKAQQAD